MSSRTREMVGIWMLTWLALVPMRGALGVMTRVCHMGDVPLGRGHCGTNLSTMLRLLCRSNYHSGSKRSVLTDPMKQSFIQHAMRGMRDPDLDTKSRVLHSRDTFLQLGTGPGTDPGTTGVFLSRASANSLLKHKRNMWISSNTFQGVVCECCYNRCSVSEMQEYCGQEIDLGKRGLLLRRREASPAKQLYNKPDPHTIPTDAKGTGTGNATIDNTAPAPARERGSRGSTWLKTGKLSTAKESGMPRNSTRPLEPSARLPKKVPASGEKAERPRGHPYQKIFIGKDKSRELRKKDRDSVTEV